MLCSQLPQMCINSQSQKMTAVNGASICDTYAGGLCDGRWERIIKTTQRKRERGEELKEAGKWGMRWTLGEDGRIQKKKDKKMERGG